MDLNPVLHSGNDQIKRIFFHNSQKKGLREYYNNEKAYAGFDNVCTNKAGMVKEANLAHKE